jgi:ketosteroid isomerase-like protein
LHASLTTKEIDPMTSSDPPRSANTLLIERFYAAFAAGDGEEMASCYAPGAHFADPVFPDLRGSEPGEMWRMLTATPGDLRIELLEHEADETSGTAHWRAHYIFSQSGRPVVNDVQARFRFEKGLIADHHDDFGFYRWSRQALGPVGLLLGWTPLVRSKVRRMAAGRLAQFNQAPGRGPIDADRGS